MDISGGYEGGTDNTKEFRGESSTHSADERGIIVTSMFDLFSTSLLFSNPQKENLI
jgi:hypothetical protein